ncbi:MAG: transposase [Shewanella sp.]|nr:transposase [Shewanella sp.]
MKKLRTLNSKDRNGRFEPQLVKKGHTTLSDEIDRKVLSMFISDMSYHVINAHIEEMYGIKLPPQG